MRIISTVGGETVRAFVPFPLPPTSPSLDNSVQGLRTKLDIALVALGRLDSISALLPDPHLFLYMYVRKEALLSSQIEGTQSSLSDLLLFEMQEAPGAPLDEVREVSNYVRALEHGVNRLRAGFPISNRLFREIHAILLDSGRGSAMEPGEFRRSQNWIGGTRPGNALFVPPPPEAVQDCMGELEKFLHGLSGDTSLLVKAALAHVQFETIHPFLDGNGRLGRLLIALLLTAQGVLREPLLYLSLYFKQNRSEYYRLLQVVRDEGDWEAWVEFFVEGVEQTATQAVTTAQQLVALFRGDRERIQSSLGKAASSALRIHISLQDRPIQTSNQLAANTGLSVPTVNAALSRMAIGGLNLVNELTGLQRNRVYAYDEYLRILREGTEPD